MPGRRLSDDPGPSLPLTDRIFATVQIPPPWMGGYFEFNRFTPKSMIAIAKMRSRTGSGIEGMA
jgi:hypothetical protein